jgi:hypothetical protein
MTWGTIEVGLLAFRETIAAAESQGTLTITGQESTPPQTAATVHAAHLNVLGLLGATVAVVPSDKAELAGYYVVTAAQSDLLNHGNGSVLIADWQLGLARLGTERDVELESRLPTLARATQLAGITPSYWHAPPSGFRDYYTGATVPASSVTRQSSDGPMTVFTGVPANVYPRWTCPAASYTNGAARVLIDGLVRVGEDTPAPAASWEVNNGVVQVTGGTGTPSITVSAWVAGQWVSAKAYTPTVNGAALTTAPEFTIVRNDPEMVVVRLSYASSPGRLTVDLLLRRGARTINGTIKRQAAATLGVIRTAAEAATAVTGGLRATSTDAFGCRFVMGSSRTLTTTTATASIAASASALAFDFFLGHEIAASPATGDAFADLLAQYLGTRLGYFGHVAVFRGIVDVTAYADTTLLQSARYVGVLREKAMRGRVLSGSGCCCGSATRTTRARSSRPSSSSPPRPSRSA